MSARTSPLPVARASSMSAREFSLFQALIRKEAGIFLSPAKQELLVNRLASRLRELALTRFEDYYRLVLDDPDERVRMLDRVSTNETHFFREPRHFDYLEEHVYPAWRARAAAGEMPRRVRIWSSACSTGEEPYSIAMSLLAHLPPESGWDAKVLGTDLSSRALDKATSALWPLDRSEHIPPAYLKSFMLRGTRSQEGRMKAGAEIRAMVELRRFNLMSESYPFRDPFDVIFCRNVLIYFDADGRKHVLERMAASLAPGGILFLGHAETALGVTTSLRAVMPSVYTKVG